MKKFMVRDAIKKLMNLGKISKEDFAENQLVDFN